jgi:hypothetical protein
VGYIKEADEGLLAFFVVGGVLLKRVILFESFFSYLRKSLHLILETNVCKLNNIGMRQKSH